MSSQNNSSPGDAPDEFDIKHLPDEASSRAREIWLAGLGALERLEDEGDKIFQSLVERGKNYEAKRREQFERATENLREQQEEFTKDVTERLDDAADSVERVVSDTLSGTLDRIGVPSRSEVRGLSRRVGELSQKLDALSQLLDAQQTAVEERVVHVVPNDNGWNVTVEGEEGRESSHDVKKEAVSAARELAKEHAPSQLVVHKQDRSVQETFSYD